MTIEHNLTVGGLGYYRRARSLLEGAKVAGKQFGGKCVLSDAEDIGRLPSDPDELEKGIPGVGRYTAGAICSIAYGVRTPIVSTMESSLITGRREHSPRTVPPTSCPRYADCAGDDKVSVGDGRGVSRQTPPWAREGNRG